MRNSALINIKMVDAAAQTAIRRYFSSSSVCIYRDMEPGEPGLTEEQAFPALPDNEYGWEKLYVGGRAGPREPDEAGSDIRPRSGLGFGRSNAQISKQRIIAPLGETRVPLSVNVPLPITACATS